MREFRGNSWESFFFLGGGQRGDLHIRYYLCEACTEATEETFGAFGPINILDRRKKAFIYLLGLARNPGSQDNRSNFRYG